MPNRQLLLLRHAKAVIGEGGMQDIDRPLARAARRRRRLMGRYMAEHDLIPDLVLCSPARRTRQTLGDRLAPNCRRSKPASSMTSMTSATAPPCSPPSGSMAAAPSACCWSTHNPATQNLALALAGSGEKALRRQMMEKYPTAGLAVLSFPRAATGRRHGGRRRPARGLHPPARYLEG